MLFPEDIDKGCSFITEKIRDEIAGCDSFMHNARGWGIHEMKNENESTFDNVTDIVASTVSGTVGAAIGAVAAGPAGAVGGALAGSVIEKVVSKIGKDIKERVLSRAESRKIDTVYTEAANIIAGKLQAGQTLRDDDFFDEKAWDRSTAEEILEGTLFAAQRESEEKKIKYYAKLYANIVFDKTITRPQANQLIKLAEQLTYRQIIILHAIGVNQLAKDRMQYKTEAYESVQGTTNVAIASEIFELYRMTLLSATHVILDVASINPSELRIVGYGAWLFNLMELQRLEEDVDIPQMGMEITRFLIGQTSGRYQR